MAGQMVPEEIVQLCRIMACTCVCAIPSVCADFVLLALVFVVYPVVVLILFVFALVLVLYPVVVLVFELVFFWFTLARVL